ncbi:hypothetical protein C1Y63_10565 [Corynebacterium sp. 13CS0277]|uniref:hypothetical protein n=1 Tax=Corynebacterium sp. 13CS0277 TaxID=2071994 RepID=UPI000D02E44D|nr:hypothetical protein [Corynebacterium sp. 13CS0277]PRQ10628.1 hypothetical protein C1Y63_10565 [Corynebacterium sp. 13CS0277]
MASYVLTVDSWEPWPPADPLHPVVYRRGDAVDVDGVDVDWAVRVGIIADADALPAPAPAPAVVVEEPAEEPAPAPAVEAPVKPKKTAPVDAWRDYATHLGIDVKGLTRAEIISAVG